VERVLIAKPASTFAGRALALAWLLPAGLLTLLAAPDLLAPWPHLQAAYFLRVEDIGLLAGLSLVTAATPLLWRLARRPGPAWRPPANWAAAALATLVALVAFFGWRLVFGGYAFSRDEDMAQFGAAIVGHGQAWAGVAPEWRGYAQALEPEFVRFAPGNGLWQPFYLPVNAAFQALAGPLANPLLAALAVGALFTVARRVWPDRPARAWAAALLLATSSQFLLAAATPYAMTGHLALNLLWLALHLRGGRAGHAGALAVGFLACGLHQLAFHPLFVAPFVLQLWLARRWATAALYTLVYAAICLFWVEFPALSLAWQGGAAAGGAVAGLGGQVAAIAAARHPPAAATMAENLIRFMTWQNLFSAPLLVLGFIPAVRAGGAMRALAAGLALTTAALIVLMPYQGYGWGYRYWHGLLGSIALIGVLGGARLVEGLSDPDRRAAQTLFGAAMMISAFVLLPIRALQAHDLVAPYARIEAAIRAAPADVVLVDSKGGWYLNDLVRNDPFLRNRPLVMRARGLTPEQRLALCASRRLALLTAADAGRLGAYAPWGSGHPTGLGLPPVCAGGPVTEITTLPTRP
jgi:hypothetical protein